MSAACRRDAVYRAVVALRLAVGVIVLLAAPVVAQGPGSTPEQRARVDALMRRVVKPGEPGGAVVVARGDTIVFSAGYGVADVETGDRITPGTVFRLASVSKQFTAAAVLSLVADGRLRLDRTLGELLPTVPAYARRVSVRQLLAHTSGVPDYEPLLGAEDGPQISDRDVLTLIGEAKRLHFEPGTSWRYSNTGYALLALVVERVSGESFASYLRHRVFDRASMATALARVEGSDAIAGRAFGHSRDANGWRKTDQNRTSAVLGDGGIYASADDLARWSAALDKNVVLTGGLFRKATTPVTLPSGASTSYGYGWFLDTHRGHRRQRHEGDSIGFRTAIQRYPDAGLTVIVLLNRGGAPIDALSDGVANVFLDP